MAVTVAEFKRARELDPLSHEANQAVVYGLLSARQNDHAIEAAKDMLELDHTNPDLHTLLGITYARKGQYREAIAAYQEGSSSELIVRTSKSIWAPPYVKAREREKARAILKRSDTGKEYVSPVAWQFPNSHLASVTRHPRRSKLLTPRMTSWYGWVLTGSWPLLRSDLRFQDLMRRMPSQNWRAYRNVHLTNYDHGY